MTADEYMNPAEFADLPFDVQCAVWDAADTGRLDYVSAAKPLPRRYHREQVLALAGTVRGGGAP